MNRGSMFERFTQPAVRSLFFSRYEASVLGSTSIETEHLLLGILKDRQPLITHLLGTANVSTERLQELIYTRVGKTTTTVDMSIEIPFSKEVKTVLAYTTEEADRLLHREIGPEHALLALLRLDQGLAWDVLSEQGLRLEPVREALVMHVSTTSPPPPEIAGMIAALSPPGVQRPRPQSAAVYSMTALAGPSPGRRVTAEDGSGVFATFSTVDFSTSAQDAPQRGVHSIGPLSMWATTLPQFALVLEEFLGAPVLMLDHNDLNQRFDIELQGTYDDTEALIAAVRDQLGLELTRSL